jgi:hypothetical protein
MNPEETGAGPKKAGAQAPKELRPQFSRSPEMGGGFFDSSGTNATYKESE